MCTEHQTCNQGKQAVATVTTIAWHKLSAPALNSVGLGLVSDIKTE